MCESLLKKTSNDEALLREHGQLMVHPQRHTIRRLISNGASVEVPTPSANLGNPPGRHFHQAITHIECVSPVEFARIGSWYRRGTIFEAEQRGGVMIDKPTELFGVEEE